MAVNEENKTTYFQYASELDLPIFLGVHLGDFDSSLTGFLTQCGFTLMPQTDSDGLDSRLEEENARLLRLEMAGTRVKTQICKRVESDRFGEESLVPSDGYRVYRYRSLALMVVSYAANEWKMGVLPEFGTDSSLMASRIVINRYLSWALAPLGVAGFWGVPVEEGVVLDRPKHSEGEAVFFDVVRNRLLTSEGVRPFKSSFHIIRLDPFLKDSSRPVAKDEVMGFLSTHCAFFSLEGLSVPVRQVIQTMARQFETYRYPQESFRPRSASDAA